MKLIIDIERGKSKVELNRKEREFKTPFLKKMTVNDLYELMQENKFIKTK